MRIHTAPRAWKDGWQTEMLNPEFEIWLLGVCGVPVQLEQLAVTVWVAGAVCW